MTNKATEFSIILPTYNRPLLISNSINSVIKQEYQNWHLYVVIDDINEEYAVAKETYADESRITFIQNAENVGKNKSLNRALDQLKKINFLGYIVYLDDDDWLSPHCLTYFVSAIKNDPYQNWFVSERVNSKTNLSFTTNRTGKDVISYQYDMLLRRKFTGDTTQCLNFQTISNVRFPTTIKNAEEWVYYAEISTKQKTFKYLPVAGTYSEGYAEDGLTDVYHSQNERWKNNKAVIIEIWQRKMFSPFIIFYLLGRLVKSLISR
ncbi:MAG: glycosyltransferase family 2 protein [Candidatus Paceibacterota bacterium]